MPTRTLNPDAAPATAPAPPRKDACELLDADHLAVKHLFVQYARLAITDPERSKPRAQLAQRICDELTVHAQIEEEILYPALRDARPDAAPLLDEAEMEHGHVKDLVARIRAHATADAELDTLVAELARSVEHHVKEERDQLFPKAKSAPSLDLATLGARLRERQQALEPSGAG
jgi:iron-sulfur cluster repair protein YtfE (RIC family)